MTGDDDPLLDPVTSEAEKLARQILALARPLLIVFDCDGVLAPIANHTDDARLGDGVGQLLTELGAHEDVTVAVLSGRSLAGLAQFEFDDSIIVAGSYGNERRGREGVPLTPREAALFDRLETITNNAAATAGPGAWVERKPTSVVLHVREADPLLGRRAVEELRQQHRELGADLPAHAGDQVLELLARASNKGDGLDALRAEISPASVVYLGDDLPDEDAFARLGHGDIGVKVGPQPTIASHRLRDPAAARTLLLNLVTQLARTDRT
jgi:trehalose-phosphatase